ncbi:hypothetical protein L6452_30914 [Arctium lappa]|uniref:Uncharacterized protein n=1 Tax=Arctium lappa TaxID=4217 RepID=A0ACB8ZJ20_ARCLA|nr:hypothetical protein L6452_30914 [Arctium lappa]
MASHDSSTPVGLFDVTTGEASVSTSVNTTAAATLFGISGSSASLFLSGESRIQPQSMTTLSSVPNVHPSAPYTVEPPIISQVFPYPPLSYTSTGVLSMTTLPMSVFTWTATPQSAASRRLFPPPPPIVQGNRGRGGGCGLSCGYYGQHYRYMQSAPPSQTSGTAF